MLPLWEKLSQHPQNHHRTKNENSNVYLSVPAQCRYLSFSDRWKLDWSHCFRNRYLFHRQTTVNQVAKFLNIMAEMTKKHPQNNFYKWEAKKARRIKIVPYASHPYLKRVIDKAFGSKKGSIRAKQCFHNSLLVCFAWSKVEYIEGYIVIGGLPIEHSWNRWNGIDFDLTQEVLLQKRVPHYEVLSLDGNQVRFWASELKTTGPYRHNFYLTRNNDNLS